MTSIQQNSVIQSYEAALIPSPNMVDARNERDRLSFMVNFASLINFYDQNNNVHNSWQPFLLKDPVLLTASISEISFKKLHSLYVSTCSDLHAVINRDPINQIDLTLALNLLFDQIIGLYKTVEFWTQFMQLSSLEYNLKSYVISQVQKKQGAIFWAIVAFREYLTIYPGVYGIRPVNMSDFDSYDQKIWKESKGKEPFWQVLGLFSSDGDETFQEYVTANTTASGEFTVNFLNDIYTSLKNTGDTFFTFLNSCIEYASVEYKTIIQKKDNYPDTTLIRTFVDVMEIYKKQINTLSKKHLNFYYNDILKQKKGFAKPDSVYACANLSFNDGTFILPNNTLFNAGEDENSETVLFKSIAKTSFNPAQINTVYTLSQAKNEHQRDLLYFKEIDTVGEIKKDEDGQIVSWDSFGSQNTAQKTNMSLAFASPLLFLNQADKRTINLKLTFQEEISQEFFYTINYFLSTEEEWFPVIPYLEEPLVSEIFALLKLIFQDIKSFIKKAFKSVKKAFNDLKKLLEKVIDFLYNFLKNVFDKLKKILEHTGKDITGEIEELFKEIWNDLKSFQFLKVLKDFFQFLEKIIGTLSNGFEKILRIIFKAIKSITSNVFEELIYLGEEIFHELMLFGEELYQEIQKILQEIEDGEIIEEIEKELKKIVNNIPILFKTIDDFIKGEYKLSRDKNGYDGVYPLDLKYKTIGLKIELTPEDPAIVAFTENPDNIESLWPMFKMEFLEFESLENPPLIETLEISVTVEGSSSLVLYNDFGALDANKPFQIFGVTAEKDQSFYLGSSEVFSKPITKLDFQLNWDNLPKNGFSAYYEQYNKYLNGDFDTVPNLSECLKSKDIQNGIFDVVIDLLKAIWNFLFVPKRKDSIALSFNEENGGFDGDLEDIDYSNFNNNGIYQFSDESFTIKFDQLSNSLWNPFRQDFSTNTLYEFIIFNWLYQGEPIEETFLLNQSFYQCGTEKNEIPINSNPNPLLQLAPLEFSETSTNGFLRMELTSEYGFGTSIYPPIVSKIALYNAEIIGKVIGDPTYKCSPTSPPNLPYVPTVGEITGNYKASFTYNFEETPSDYPIECFYYTPFSTYKIYDNVTGIKPAGISIGSSLDNLEIINPPLPLYPSFKAKGQLFLPLDSLLVPNDISFYFELSRSDGGSDATEKEISYSYLSNEGWKNLDILSDGTKNMNCSGILTLNIPDEIAKKTLIFPSIGQWISIAVADNPENYSQTSFLKTNGFELTRTGTNFLSDTEIPQINADTITGPEEAIPQIQSIVQPFPSFGGKAMETTNHMNRRVSTRLKTKDRYISSTDYFRTIHLNFLDIYFSKVIYDSVSNETRIYLVKKLNDWQQVNAFLPLVTACKELEILSYLEAKTSSLVDIKVLNFEMAYVKVKANVSMNSGYSKAGVFKEISQSINLFLSPWIKSDAQQIEIDQGLNSSEIESLIKQSTGVSSVENVFFKIGTKESSTKEILYGDYIQRVSTNSQDSDVYFSNQSLLVPSLDNQSIHVTYE